MEEKADLLGCGPGKATVLGFLVSLCLTPDLTLEGQPPKTENVETVTILLQPQRQSHKEL